MRKAILLNADDELIKTIVECVINTLNGNHTTTAQTRTHLGKFKHCLRKICNPRVPLPQKRKIIIQKGGFLGVLLSSILSGLIGRLLNK